VTRFGRGEAREWANEHLRGVAGCLSATLTADLSGLNEAAVRHDVRLEIEHGYTGMLLVSENGTTPAEMRRLIDVAVDEADGRILTILQASEPTLQANIDLIRYAEDAGVDLVLPSFPLTFYPLSEDEVHAYFKAMADATSMGMIVFAIHLWNFTRLHPSGFSPRLIGRLIDDCPNVVAVKNEIGAPGIAGISEVFERFRDRVVITDPFEMNAPAWVRAYGMQFLGTSNYEYLGPLVPRMFSLLQTPGGYDEAMELYWKMHPARQANMRVMGDAVAGTNLVPRMLWKYQGWLTGYNGGPIRSPQGRITDAQMTTLRGSLHASGVPVPDEPDAAFFVGRNPD
jgi:dihydrodipicolinate synthase/N-acetylneuraminate lyase